MNNNDSSVIYERGQKKRSFNKPIFIFIIIFLILFFVPFILIFVSFSAFNNIGEKVSEKIIDEVVDSETKVYPSYTVDEVKGFYDSDAKVYYIEGYLKNIDSYDFNDVSIKYLVYDKDGILLGEALAFVTNLKVGNTWKFKATYSDIDSDEVVSYDLSDIDIY